jgi:hypothetical protein
MAVLGVANRSDKVVKLKPKTKVFVTKAIDSAIKGREDRATRKWSQLSQAALVREEVSLRLLVVFYKSILAGHGEAVIVWVEDHPDGGYVSWPEHGEQMATMQDKQWATLQLRLMGWGQPASAKEAEEMFARGAKNHIPVEGAVPLATIAAIRKLLGAGGSASTPDPASDHDATSTPHELDEGAIEVGDLAPAPIIAGDGPDLDQHDPPIEG